MKRFKEVVVEKQKVDKATAKKIGDDLGVDWSKVDAEEFRVGIEVEQEHTDELPKSAQIALDHLAEIPDYYTRLIKMEKEAGVKEGSSVKRFKEYLKEQSYMSWPASKLKSKLRKNKELSMKYTRSKVSKDLIDTIDDEIWAISAALKKRGISEEVLNERDSVKLAKILPKFNGKKRSGIRKMYQSVRDTELMVYKTGDRGPQAQVISSDELANYLKDGYKVVE